MALVMDSCCSDTVVPDAAWERKTAPGAIRAAKALGGRAEASDAASGKENKPPDNTIPL